jgi:Gly-Xaa carboxypeptidase
MGTRFDMLVMQLMIGATDCKNNLLGVLDALEFLLKNNFEPKRTILAGFGFDEEIRYTIKIPALTCSGPQGASNISALLLDRYGKNSVEFIIDEGGSEVKDLYGATFALPGTAEKVCCEMTRGLR